MSERMEATALALDAYEQHLFGELANGHRTDHAEAEGLLHALVVDLINYGEGNRLDVVDLLDALVQARIDRGGAITNPRYSFRLNTEVQFRDHGAEPHRGFITELKSSGPGQDAECVLRIPGIIDPQHTSTAALQPATRMVPLSTRTAGTVFSASAAEDTITDLLTRLPAGHGEADTDPRMLADLAELSTTLGAWSGTSPGHVLQHLRYRASQIHRAPDDWSSTARRAATGFPNDIAALLAGEQPAPSPSSRPDPPRPNQRPHLM